MRLFALLSTFLALALPSQAQIVIKGDSVLKVGTLQSLTIEENSGKNLKIEVLKNGKTCKEGWQLLKTLDDKPILLVMVTEEARYTFVFASSEGEKTNLVTHTLEPENAPIKPDPDPKPAPTANLAVKIKALKPDLKLLNKYQTIWESLNSRKFDNFGTFESVLKSEMAKGLQPNELKDVRDLVAKFLLDNLKDDPRRTSVSDMQSTIDQIIAALKEVK